MFKKKSKKKTEELLKSLYEDYVVMDENVKKAEKIQRTIKLRLDNSIDDKIKVSRAFHNAQAQGAYSDASILEQKLNELDDARDGFERDYKKISSTLDHFRSVRAELSDQIESIKTREDEVKLTYEAARMQHLSNVAYDETMAMDSDYNRRKAEAQRQLDTEVSMKELNTGRVSSELERKYEEV